MITGGRFDLAFLAASRHPEVWQIVDKRLRGYYTIQLMERGAVELSYDDRRYELEGTWFWPAYPGPRTRFTSLRSRETWHHRHVAFHGPLMNVWIEEGLWPDGPQPVDPAEYVPRVDELVELVWRGDESDRRRAVNRLEGILLDLAAIRNRSVGRESWLTTVLSRIEADPFATDFDRVAEEVGFAPSTLRRRFRAAMGTSLHEHAITTRLVRARALLQDTDLTLESIADLLGYRDPAFFARQFRRKVGLSPSTYRRSRR